MSIANEAKNKFKKRFREFLDGRVRIILLLQKTLFAAEFRIFREG